MSILGNYLRAREGAYLQFHFQRSKSTYFDTTFLLPSLLPTAGAYFKVEQEAAVQQRKQKLQEEGKLPLDDDKNAATEPSLAESEAVYQTLPEIMQAQARIHDPNAAKNKQREIRIKGAPAPLTEDERRLYRVSAYALTGAVGHIPKLSLSGRNRYGIPSAAATAGDQVMLRRALSPEAVEVARRTYSAGVRALVYGSLLGFGVIAAGGTLTANYFLYADSSSSSSPAEEMRRSVQRVFEPVGEAVRAKVLPWKAKIEAMSGRSEGAQQQGTLQSQLKERYNPG